MVLPDRIELSTSPLPMEDHRPKIVINATQILAVTAMKALKLRYFYPSLRMDVQ